MPSSTSSPTFSDGGNAALRVEHLTGPTPVPIIHDVSIEVYREETRLVLGPIQAGKSMIMRHIVGLEQPSSGRIFLEGRRVDGAAESEIQLRRLRSRVGVVFEGSALISRLSAVENVELPLLEHSDIAPGEARDAARELLAEVGMTAVEEAAAEALGRAAQRRVALARALALRPAVLLLDEPTQGLDAHTAHELDECILALQSTYGFATLIFSHEVRHAFGMAGEIYVMSAGTIVAQGAREVLAESEDDVVRQLFHRRGAA